MDLWHGTISNFIKEGEASSITGIMLNHFWNYHGYQPSEGEAKSWDNSLHALAGIAEAVASRDVGVVLEYHLPYSGYRIDALFFGKDSVHHNSASVVELKQWSDVELIDDYSLNVEVGGKEHIHPSQQAYDYSEHLAEIQSSFIDDSIRSKPCAFCHNLPAKTGLEDPRFADILKKSPLFKKQDDRYFAEYLNEAIGRGNGIHLMNSFTNGRFRPNKKLLDILDSVINKNEQWHLLEKQRIAFNTIWAQILKSKRGINKNKSTAILVRGGPGTGKTVIATQLLADANRNNFTAIHSTGGKSFTTNLRAQFKGADKLFAWNLNMRNAPTQGLDVLLVDEAHRIRYTSDTRWTPKAQQNKRSQIEELLAAAKVTVFFLDENQYVRPDEIGCTQLIRDETRKLGIPLIEYDLDAQFRCGGCTEYIQWLDHFLGFSSVEPSNWTKNYSFKIVDSPEDLEKIIPESKEKKETSRLVAGFCWPWSNPRPDGSLVNDVVIGTWSHPWNAKAMESRSYKPENHPYTLWASTEAGENQIGCIYSAQGFEFDSVGVIWGPDLVWRNDRWVAQKDKSKDSPVKAAKSDTLRLVKNAYRVLLTRGIKQTRVLCLDEETREHLLHEITRLNKKN